MPNVSPIGKNVLIGESLPKPRLLNPFKRIKIGNEVNVKVNGQDVVAIVDRPGVYTYLNVDGVDCYVTGALTEGAVFTTQPWSPKEPAKKVKVEAAAEEVEAAAEEVEAAVEEAA